MQQQIATGRRNTYHHGDLRRALIDAALRLIAAEGAGSFTLREVARRARVSHAAPYRHFPDKMALLAAVAEEGFRALRERLLAVGAGLSSEPLRHLQTLGVEYVRFAVEHPAHFQVMFGSGMIDPLAYPAVHEVSQGTFHLLVQAMVAGQRMHAVRSGAPPALALIAWSQVHGLATLLVHCGVPMTDAAQVTALAEQATRVLYEGLQGDRQQA